MKKLEVSDETFAALERLAQARGVTPVELIETMLGGGRAALTGDQLLLFLGSEDFLRLGDATDRYLALLAWCARQFACDFADFISHQESGRRYLAWSPEEINEARARNHARQIDGTQFWAVTTIDDAARRRFLCRLLEFIGCHDETIAQAVAATGLVPAGARLVSA